MTIVAATAVQEERHRLTALESAAAVSQDALSSVAYGPEAAALPARQLGAGS
jgi:hypothetical protein